MKFLLFFFIFAIHLLHAQPDTNSHVGKLNNPNVEYPDVPTQIYITSEPNNRDVPSLIKLHYHGRDTTFELVYDPSYQGTGEELHKAINEGTLEKYYVIEQDGKLYERIKTPATPQPSLFEEYWMYAAAVLLIAGFIFYKFSYGKPHAETNSTDAINEEEDEFKANN